MQKELVRCSANSNPTTITGQWTVDDDDHHFGVRYAKYGQCVWCLLVYTQRSPSTMRSIAVCVVITRRITSYIEGHRVECPPDEIKHHMSGTKVKLQVGGHLFLV